jgi:hypothetical protein
MDLHDVLRTQRERILRENNGAWVTVCDGLLSRIEELEVRMAMYDMPVVEEAAKSPIGDEVSPEELEARMAILVSTEEMDEVLKHNVSSPTFVGPVDTPPVTMTKRAKRLNGNRCQSCDKPLRGTQRMFCSKTCANTSYYLRKINPGVTTTDDVKTIVAGSGWQGSGQKRRKYKKFDQLKAEKSATLVRVAKVPALA